MTGILDRLNDMKEIKKDLDRENSGVIIIDDTNQEENETIKMLAKSFGDYIDFLNSTNNLRVEIKDKELYKRIQSLSPKQKEKLVSFLDILDSE